MALRAGYYGVKRALKDKLAEIAGAWDDTIQSLNSKVDWSSYAKTGAINRMPNTAASSGIFTVNDDGSITINGTPTETVVFLINNYGKWLEDGKTYYLSGITGGASDTYKLDITTASEALITATDGEISFTANNAANYRARIVVYANKTVNTTIYPMVADSPNVPYAPYAMTNRELTTEVSTIDTTLETHKTEINAIISAATGAADFAAFKTAMAALTPLTRSAALVEDTRSLEIEETPEEPTVEKKTTRKKSTAKADTKEEV